MYVKPPPLEWIATDWNKFNLFSTGSRNDIKYTELYNIPY